MSIRNASAASKFQIADDESSRPIFSLGSSVQEEVLHILHVDDDLCLLEVSKQILTMENNFDIENVTSVDEALKKMEQQSYDAIVSDYEMPLKNGLDFLKELREKSNQIPFILLTGKGREDVAVKALNLGADSYINKNGSTETVYCELADAINKTVERKKSRELLGKSESKYHALVENSLQGIAILLAAPIRIVFANSAFGKILGYSTEELTSLSPEGIMRLVYREDRAVFFKRVENRLRGEPAGGCFEFRAVRKDGLIIWLSSLANRVDYDGQPAVQGMFLDISERKKAEEVVRKSEVRYRELANFLPEIVFETDLSGKITFFSQTAFEITGFTEEDIEKGMNMLQFVVPEDRERAKENVRRRLAGEKTDTSEYTIFRKNGDTYHAIVKTAPIFSENRAIGLRGLVIDITERKNTEAAMREIKDQLELQIKRMPIGYIVWDKDFKAVSWNPAAEKIFGYSEKEVIGKHPYGTIVPKEAQPTVEKIWKRLLEGDATAHSINENFTKNGKKIICSWINTPLKREDNSIIGVLSMVQDITENKKMEETLRQERNMLESVTSASGAGLVIIGKDYHVQYANDFIKRYKGDTIGKLCYATLNSLDAPCPDCGVAKIYAGKTTLDSHEYCSTTVDGAPYWVEIVATPLTDENGNVTSAVEIAVDITERKKTQEALADSAAKYRALVENADDAILLTDLRGKHIYRNHAYYKSLGYEEGDNIELDGFSKVHPDDAPIVKEKMSELLRTGSIVSEYRVKHRDGRWLHRFAKSTLIYNSLNQPYAILAIIRDVTERKKTEEKIMWLASFPMLNPNPVLEVSFEGNINYLNSAAESIFPDLKKKGLSHPLLSGWNDLLATFRNEKTHSLGRNIKIKENWFHQQFNVHIETQRVHIYVTNITEAKLAEKALLENEVKFRIYVENSPVAVFVANSEGKYEYVNEAASELLGYSTKELMGMSIQQVIFVGESKVFSKVKKTGRSECETVLRSKDGLPVFVILNSVRLPDGKLVAFCENITERKKTEDKLRESINKNELINEKLGVVGSLTRHDVGNKLMVIKSNMFLLKKQIGDDPKLGKYLEGIDSAIKSSDEMFEFSRSYEKIVVENPSEIDVAQCFNQAVALLPGMGTIKIVNDCQELKVTADSLLKQLFYIFLDNSLKYGEKVTQIRLHFTKDGGGVKLFYEDNGVGISEVNRPKLFHEGFTTGKGTGLGLYLIKKLVEVYGWTITEEGEAKGARFVITIPWLNKNGKESFQIA